MEARMERSLVDIVLYTAEWPSSANELLSPTYLERDQLKGAAIQICTSMCVHRTGRFGLRCYA